MIDPSFTNSALRVTALGCGMAGALTDIRSRRVPNWLTLPCMLFGVSLHFLGGGWIAAANALGALGLCGAAFLLFYLAGGMGAGDVKLIAAEASLLGLSCSVPLLIYTALCGGIMGLMLAAFRGQVQQTLRNVLQLTLHHGQNGLTPHPELNVRNRETLRLPYAVAIACGCAATILQPVLVPML